ncbi:MAG: hypothetical protein LUG62_11545 [Clostridiales bacterium]|nr:hypothetical protein [Clostridiales bacterium]
MDAKLSGEDVDVTGYEQYDNGIKIIGTSTCEAQIIDRDNYQILIDAGYYEADEIEPTVTPTPEPIATVTPTPKPTATVTPTPKPTATPTITPKPTVTTASKTKAL